MMHVGDITQINGADLPKVDCITGGSPCQELSVAGTMEGLTGERSRLFFEQIRVIKEMREDDRRSGATGDCVRPRYAVWENVKGALSSPGGARKGQDFQRVLTEFVRIAEPDAPDVPLPEKGGWPHAGCLMGYGTDGTPFSIAWRLHDAQFWGLPQRRTRISVVADFGGLSAPEILFERKELSRDSETCGTQREEAAGDVGGGFKAADTFNGTVNERAFQSLTTAARYPDGTGQKVLCIQGNSIDRADTARCNGKGWTEDVSYTLNTIDRPAVCVLPFDTTQVTSPYNGSNPQFGNPCHTLSAGSHPLSVVCAGFKHKASGTARGIGYEEEKAPSLIAGQESAVYDARGNGNGKTVPTLTGDHENRVTDYTALCIGNGQANQSVSDKAGALNTMHDQQAVMVPDVAHALKGKANCDFRADSETYLVQNCVVRRLTPLECERLQGYPDGWTSLNPISDMSDEDYAFWQNVLFEKNVRSERIRQNEEGVWEIWRVKKLADPDDDEEEDEWENTHKPYKHKTRKQMIAWYNRSFAGDSDTPRYKALGNSIALPFWFWLMRRISAQYPRQTTLGSLFDGIGGFPLCWERCNGKGTALWASEIDEFCIAVTKKHFQEEGKQ